MQYAPEYHYGTVVSFLASFMAFVSSIFSFFPIPGSRDCEAAMFASRPRSSHRFPSRYNTTFYEVFVYPVVFRCCYCSWCYTRREKYENIHIGAWCYFNALNSLARFIVYIWIYSLLFSSLAPIHNFSYFKPQGKRQLHQGDTDSIVIYIYIYYICYTENAKALVGIFPTV